MAKNDGYKLLEKIKKDYTANVLLSQTVSKHLLYAMGDIENLLKELFTEMKNEDPSSLPIELKKLNGKILPSRYFKNIQRSNCIELMNLDVHLDRPYHQFFYNLSNPGHFQFLSEMSMNKKELIHKNKK